MMEIVKFNDESIKEEIVKFIRNGTLIPIIGSGFTRGESVGNGTVPSGTDFKEQMINEIIKLEKSMSYDELINEDFSEVSEIFWDIVGESQRKSILKTNFIGVKLNDTKKKFLEIDWPYMYTLNIDDGIEKNSAFKPVLPYKRINKEQVDSMKRVYKMHGDAFEEITYHNNEESIIFNRDHYIKSLEENKEILNEFISDYKENNIIYIGCSLDDEIDLHYAVSKAGDLSHIKTNRYFVTNEEITAKKRIKLKKYGINKILTIANYGDFYSELVDIALNNVVFGFEQLNQFKNPKIESLGESKDINLKSLLNGEEIYKDNKFLIPKYFIERECTKDIIEDIENNDFVALVGRRISGKTFILADITRKIKNMDVYFFPSTVIVSEEIISKLIELKNSIFIFDSNSLEFSNLLVLKRNIDILKQNNSKVIIVANTNDNIMFTFSKDNIKNKFKVKEIPIDNILTTKEYERINKNLSQIGIAEFVNEEKKKNKINKLTILDNIVRLVNHVYKRMDSKLIVDNINISNDVNPNHLKVLILLATGDKIYRPMLQLIGISDKSLEEMKKKYSPIIDIELSTKIEKKYHTREKIICNSKVWLLYLLGQYSGLPSASEKIGGAIGETVECLVNYRDYKQVIKNMILFDTLNQIFVKEQKGAIKVIFDVYSCLQSTLYDNRNYWLQRAKSILSLKRTEEDELNNALDYALKAFNDSDKDEWLWKIKENSSLTIAMIYGRLFSLSKRKNVGYFNNCVYWYHTAIVEFNANLYINDFIEKSKKHKSNRQRSDLEVVLYEISKNNSNLSNENLTKAFELYRFMSSSYDMVAITESDFL